jgi:excisionase family DNA binding protein
MKDDQSEIQETNMNESLMTADEVAKYLKVNLSSVRKWSREGKLRGYRLGGSGDWRYVRPEVVAFVRGSKN